MIGQKMSFADFDLEREFSIHIKDDQGHLIWADCEGKVVVNVSNAVGGLYGDPSEFSPLCQIWEIWIEGFESEENANPLLVQLDRGHPFYPAIHAAISEAYQDEWISAAMEEHHDNEAAHLSIGQSVRRSMAAA